MEIPREEYVTENLAVFDPPFPCGVPGYFFPTRREEPEDPEFDQSAPTPPNLADFFPSQPRRRRHGRSKPLSRKRM